VTPRPDASVRVSQGLDIFAKAASSKSHGLSAHQPLCGPARPFPFTFFGSASPLLPNIFLVSDHFGGEKENTRQCFASKIMTLRAVPTVSKPLSTLFPSSLLLFDFFSAQSYVS